MRFKMENRETILSELRQISEVVANLPNGNTYTVPPCFFDEFPDAVLARIKAAHFSINTSDTPFRVPEGYFEGFAASVLQKVQQQQQGQTVAEELAELAPLLNTINKAPVYTVPEGYFENLAVHIPAQAEKPVARVVGMARPNKWLRYAAAACTAGILMVGAYLYTSNNNGTDAYAAGNVIPYDSAVSMNVHAELADVNENEIDQYLKESPAVGYAINAVLTSPEEVDVEQNINAATEEEIKQFLEEAVETKGTQGI